MLYPTKAPRWIHWLLRAVCAHPGHLCSETAIFFIYLLIIYPACPAKGKKSDDSTCTSHRFFFLSRERLHLCEHAPRGRSAGPEEGRGVSTPPSLPLDSTHPTTRKGLLAPFRPQRRSRSGKMLAASLKAFFALLRFAGPSAAAAAAPRRGAGAPSPSAPVGRIHLSQRERQETFPLRPWLPLRERCPRAGGGGTKCQKGNSWHRKAMTERVCSPAGANAPGGSRRQHMPLTFTTLPVKKQIRKIRRSS